MDKPAGKLRLNKILEKLWVHILADFIIKLPLAQYYDLILVIYNYFSKITHFVVTMEKTLVEKLARLFRNYVWKLYEFPESIISDQRLQFAAGLWESWTKYWELKQNY